MSSKYLSIWTQRPCDAVCSVAINSYFSWLMTFSSSLNTFIAQIKGKCYFDATHSVTQTGSNSFAKSNVSFYSTASQLLSVWWTFPCQPSSWHHSVPLNHQSHHYTTTCKYLLSCYIHFHTLRYNSCLAVTFIFKDTAVTKSVVWAETFWQWVFLCCGKKKV